MCCVMPPASRSATFVSRIASSSVVLPWSTWPMTVTTGARGTRSSGFDASVSTSVSSSSKLRISTSAPKSRAMIVRGLRVERRVDGHHHAAIHELLQHVLGLDLELVGEVLDRHAFGQRDELGDRRRRLAASAGIDGRSSRRAPTTATTRSSRTGGCCRMGRGGRASGRPARDCGWPDGPAATAAAAVRRAADGRATSGRGRMTGGRARRPGADGRRPRRRRRRLLRPNDRTLRQRPRGRRFAGQRVFDAQTPRRRHDRGPGARRPAALGGADGGAAARQPATAGAAAALRRRRRSRGTTGTRCRPGLSAPGASTARRQRIRRRWGAAATGAAPLRRFGLVERARRRRCSAQPARRLGRARRARRSPVARPSPA